MYAGRVGNTVIVSDEARAVAAIIESIVVKFNEKYGID